MLPGIAQRVYGFEDGKGKAVSDANLLRLLLASARNAKEIAPGPTRCVTTSRRRPSPSMARMRMSGSASFSRRRMLAPLA